jgi:uncharacterized protein
MTPQEQQLVADLFDRLTSLEGQPRDPDAERVIAEGLRRAPHSVYALVQSVLLQDEALKRANSRIEELEHAAGDEKPAQGGGGGFLDTMRSALTGERSRGSVPSVPPARPGGQGTSGVWGQRPEAAPSPAYAPPPSYGGPMGATMGGPMGGPMGGGMMPGGGGSFLGTAAATVAGVIGGGLMLDGIRSMMGGGHHGLMGDSFRPGEASHMSSPWDTGSGELSREAGVNDIDTPGSGGHRDVADNSSSSGSGFLSSGDDNQQDDNDADNDDGNYDDASYDDGGGDDGGGSDDA